MSLFEKLAPGLALFVLLTAATLAPAQSQTVPPTAQQMLEMQIGQLVFANAQCGQSVNLLQQQLEAITKERDGLKAQLDKLTPKDKPVQR